MPAKRQANACLSDKRLAELAAQAELAAIEKELPAAEISVTFRVNYRCAFGQGVAVVGSTSELGNWDFRAAPRLHWGEGDVWTATVTLKHQRSPVAYKYVVVEHGNPQSSVLRWETGDNHTLSLPGAGVVKIKLADSWEQV